MATKTRTLELGLIVGLIGYASVAVFYMIFDLLAARGILYTVNLLGQVVFRGLRDPAVVGLPIRLDFTAIEWYTLLHFVASLIIGLIVTWLVRHATQHASRARLISLVIVAGFIVTIFLIGALTASVRPLLPWWSIVVANALAVILAGAYLLKKQPALWGHLMPHQG